MSRVAYAALWIFVFTLPWENALIIVPGVRVISKVTGALALGLALAAAVMSGRFRRWQGLHVAALLFVLWMAGGLLFFYVAQTLPKKFYTFVQLAVMLWMVWEIARSWSHQLGLLTAYVFGAYVASLDTLFLFWKGGVQRRFAAGEADPNSLAMTLALALPMAWYLGVTSHKPLMRWVYRGYFAAGLLAIGLTGSRGGMLATAVALLVVPLTMTKLPPGRLAAAVIMLGLAGALAVAYVPEKIVERLATTGTEVEELSLGGRFTLWRAGVKAFVNRPLTGYGSGAWRTAVSPWLGPNPQVAHNSFLSVLVETGLVGLLIYSLMFLTVFLAVRDLPSLERRFGLVLLVTLGVAMFPLTWEDQKAVWFILALLLGMARATSPGPGRAVGPPRPLHAPPVVRPPVAARLRGRVTAPWQNTYRDPTT
jgi:O-antigen ligase